MSAPPVMLVIAMNAAVLFAGAALYNNVAEHPARMLLDDLSALKQWAPSYKHAAVMQASLAVVSAVTSFLTWWSTGSLFTLLAALLIGAVLPFTLLVIMPVNQQLLAQHKNNAVRPDTRSMLQHWNQLHAVRTGLALMSVLMYSLVLLQH